VSSHFEEVRPLTGVGDEDTTEEISSVWCDILGERQRSRHDILVEKVDIVAFGVGRIVIEGKVASEHRVLISS
jgi:hypothetical protein